MPKIKLVHDEPYNGTDPATGQRLELQPGDTADVSDAKAEQLLADFPDWFKPARGRKADPPTDPPASGDGEG